MVFAVDSLVSIATTGSQSIHPKLQTGYDIIKDLNDDLVSSYKIQTL